MAGPNRVIPPLKVDPDGTFDSRYWDRNTPLPEGPPGPPGPEGPQGPKPVIVSTEEPLEGDNGDLWYNPEGIPEIGDPVGLTKTEADKYYAPASVEDDTEQLNTRMGAVESDVTALPTIIAGNYTKRLGNYESLAAAIADLPDAGANGGEIQVDGEVPVSATLSVPGKVWLTGRGSQASAFVAPAGVNFPVLDLDGASKAHIHGISILKASGANASGDARAVLIRGNADDVVLDDVFAEEFVTNFAIDGSLGTTPGIVRRLSMRSVRSDRAIRSWGIGFDHVDVVNLVDCHSRRSFLDGYKLRARVNNFTMLGGSGNENGQGYLENPSSYAGDGLDGYAGGDTYTLDAVTFDDNYGHGVQIKTGPLNVTDPEAYGFPKNMELNVRAKGNQEKGLTVNVSDINDLTMPLVANVHLNGGMYQENGSDGWYINARNVTVSGTQSVRNAGNGGTVGPRAMDVVLDTPICIGNGYPTTNGADGIVTSGRNVTILSPVIIGRDADTIGTEADYTGTIYTRYPIWITNQSTGRVTVRGETIHDCGLSYIMVSNSDAIVHLNESGPSNPTSGTRYGSAGSTYFRTGTPNSYDQHWEKRGSFTPNSTAGWFRSAQLHVVTSLPTAQAAYESLVLYLQDGASSGAYCCVGKSGVYTWEKMTP